MSDDYSSREVSDDDPCYRTAIRVDRLQSRISGVEGAVKELKQEIQGTPGDGDSGLKTMITRLNLKMGTLERIGWAIATAVILDIVSRVLLAAASKGGG